ncbi:hypothetical protein GALMADRAFT_205972 [Galerina marginata CBS 339.88]|uniref:receptor protein-tyrosine kinase n=1 Tax=Galerina marginata (strain CBS 339.88) TaxID=685588 RepID=A0A067TM09_GALM3|nr:hypothetical protein GALMADRAFT_205972 [Galerina marginata CBS 339.88]
MRGCVLAEAKYDISNGIFICLNFGQTIGQPASELGSRSGTKPAQSLNTQAVVWIYDGPDRKSWLTGGGLASAEAELNGGSEDREMNEEAQAIRRPELGAWARWRQDPGPLRRRSADSAGNYRTIGYLFPLLFFSFTFILLHPSFPTQFHLDVSDARSFGSGGTSVAAQVTTSGDASCFDATKSVSPDFVFSLEPANQIVQCVDTRIWWDPATVQGTPNFLGIIPGGQSFSIPQGSITQVASQGTGFTWKPSLRGGTTLIIVGGDNRGNGTAGSSLNVVSSGFNNDGSCLSDSSPSSTPGSPAGGSYPTGTGTGSTGKTGGGSSNIGAIVGGVVGGLAALIIALLLLWFCRRRQKKQKRTKERPVDLINADDDGDESPANGHPRRNELPQFYQPEPFMVPDPTLDGSVTGTDDIEGSRPMSGASTSFYTRATTPDALSGSGVGGSSGAERRKGAPRPMRAVNIIQHDDAGPSLPPADKDGEDEPETIELPPAYTAVRTASNRGPATPTAVESDNLLSGERR